MMAHAASPEDMQPEARAYVNVSFGGHDTTALPFQYGLRVDHDRRLTTDEPLETLPAIAQLEFNNLGESVAAINGVPFARTLRLNQYGVEKTYGFIDWGLILVGAAGIGFVAAEVVDTDESPDPAPGSDGGDGDGDTCLPGTPLCAPFSGGSGSFKIVERTAPDYQQWLDSGTGHMGDLLAR